MPALTSNTIARIHYCYIYSLAAILVSGSAVTAIAHDLPLGDGKVSSQPKIGYVYSCQQQFNPNAPGARASGDWLGKTSWDPEKKPKVQGSVNWPSQITITLEAAGRVVRANNLPSHPTGTFPIQRDDPAYQYDRNPSKISEQDIILKLPAIPSAAGSASCVPMGMIGFSLTNVAIFNALDARGDDAPAHEIQDKCNGHPQQTGQYHYHNLSPCIDDARSQAGQHSDLIGYAADGFGLFGKFGANGKQVTNADLDGCHGHSHSLTWDGTQQDIYHYGSVRGSY